MTLKILIVDDSDDIRSSLHDLLSLIGYPNIFTAESGKDALNLLKTETVDVILSDLHMPQMDGLEFHKEFKKMNLNSFFVLISGAYFDEEATKPLDTDILTLAKPFGIEKLKQLLSSLDAKLKTAI